MRNHTRATIYFSADIFKALRMKIDDFQKQVTVFRIAHRGRQDTTR
jgi:hypothetical protein